MDVFSRTFLPATADAGLSISAVSRHMPVIRRCVTPEETALLVARCQRPGLPVAGTFLLLLTNRRLVLTRQSRLLQRVQLHLTCPLRELSDVSWHRRGGGMEFAATAADGERERFWIPLRDPVRSRHLDALLDHLFRPGGGAAGPHRTTGRRPYHTLASA